jgi:hypothetical protein
MTAERRDPGIVNARSRNSAGLELAPQVLPITDGLGQHDHGRAFEPAENLLERVAERRRRIIDSRMADHRQELVDARPGDRPRRA